MRLLIIGNSGSGKSTLARQAATTERVPHLELDSIVWEPHQIAVARPLDAVHADLDAFIAEHPAWVIEGCDGDLAERALPTCTELVFMNPGVDVCTANNRRRPWEPHKYDSAADQESKLSFLLDWVASYYTRDDARSYAFHRKLFDGFTGAKREQR